MYNLDEILRIDNFEHLSQTQMLEIITILRNELKYQLYKKDYNAGTIQNQINTIQTELFQSKELNGKYKDVIKRFNKMYGRKLTFKERLFGKINNNIVIDEDK